MRGWINERVESTRLLTRLAIVREALQRLAALGELKIRLRDNLIHRVCRAREDLADIAMTAPHQFAGLLPQESDSTNRGKGPQRLPKNMARLILL